jgi:hypothetical protein
MQMQREEAARIQAELQIPFQRFRHHMFVPGLLPLGSPPGCYDVTVTSPLFQFCKLLCRTGGSWIPSPNAIAGYRLVGVQAVIHGDSSYSAYEHRQGQMLQQRVKGGKYFNFETRSMSRTQLLVLDGLRQQFLERRLDADPLAVNSFYCFHGPKREHLDSICSTGLVATRDMDAGDFGSGCYSTLNIEYAVKYAHGVFDGDAKRRPPSSDGRYPVIMFAASVSVAYPVTREVDYAPDSNQSNFFGRPLKPGFDCHVACVNRSTNFQAVDRDECQYMEVVIDQQSQMLPVAVLWFEET